MILDRDGSIVQRPIPTHGADWDWILGITPMPDLEGWSAIHFLEWVARERGWTLVELSHDVPTLERVFLSRIRRIADQALVGSGKEPR